MAATLEDTGGENGSGSASFRVTGPRGSDACAGPLAFVSGSLLACFSLGAALLVGYFTFAAGRDMLNDRARSTLLATTQILTQHLQTGFGSVARHFPAGLLVAQTQDRDAPGAAQVLDKDRLASAFRAMLTARPAYLQIRWISAQDHGLELVRVERSDQGLVRIEGDALQEKAHFPFVFETLKLGANAIYMSEFGLNHEGGMDQGAGQPVFNMATSVVQGGRVLGVVVIRVAADGFFANFSAGLPTPYAFYLTNRWGDFSGARRPAAGLWVRPRAAHSGAGPHAGDRADCGGPPPPGGDGAPALTAIPRRWPLCACRWVFRKMGVFWSSACRNPWP